MGLSSNYRSSDTTTGSSPLTVATTGGTSTSPSIVDAVGGNSYFGGTSCTGMQAKGGEGTYYAGALFVAQEYLANNSRTNAANVMILLSDGDAKAAPCRRQQQPEQQRLLQGLLPILYEPMSAGDRHCDRSQGCGHEDLCSRVWCCVRRMWDRQWGYCLLRHCAALPAQIRTSLWTRRA